jgi:hypothetical protein
MLFKIFKKLENPNLGILVVFDIMARYWRSYLVIFLLSATAFVMQVAGISILISCIRGVTNRYSEFFGMGFLGMSSGFLFLILAPVVLFIARYLGVQIMVAYEGHCANRIIQGVRKKSGRTCGLDDAIIMKLLSKDCRFGGRIAQEVSGVIMPAGIGLAAFPAMIYLNYQATLILMLVLLPTALLYWWISKVAKSVSFKFEDAAALDGQYKKETLAALRDNKIHKEQITMPHAEFKKRYAHRLIIAHCGILAGGIQMALCLLTLSIWFSQRRQSGVIDENIVIYAFVAVLAFSQLKSLPKVFANFHVFLAYFQRAFVLIYDIKSIEVSSLTEAPKDLESVFLDLES